VVFKHHCAIERHFFPLMVLRFFFEELQKL